MAKVKTMLTSDKIASKLKEFEAKIDLSIEAKKGGRISQAKIFLNEIKSLIKKAIDNNVSYKQLSSDIFDIYNFKVSEQTIRAFAYNVLKVEKKSRSYNKKETKSNRFSSKISDI